MTYSCQVWRDILGTSNTKGVFKMEYEIIEMAEKTVAGFSVRTNNSSPTMQSDIGGLWQRFFTPEGFFGLTNKVNEKALGIYTDYENDEKGDYTVMTACEVADGNVGQQYEVRTIPAGKYAKFVVKGNMVTAVGEFWQKLWTMELDRSFVCDYEEYQNADPDNCEIHIYIGLK